MKPKTKDMLVVLIVIIVLVAAVVIFYLSSLQKQNTIKIGFIGPITSSAAKYGSHEAVSLAVEEINQQGGINGKQITLISEDGRCDSKEAVSAVNKLISVDNVKIILGGHCTPESVAIAPIVEKNKVIMLASITTTPVLTPMGDYVFRTSPISTIQSDLIADLSYNKLGLRNFAIIYEQTDYARPIAEKLKQ